MPLVLSPVAVFVSNDALLQTVDGSSAATAAWCLWKGPRDLS